MYGLVEVTYPTSEPVSVADAKRHLGVSDDEVYWDADIEAQLRSARVFCETYTSLSLSQRQFLVSLDRFPAGSVLYLPRSPLVSVELVEYIDPDGTTQTMAPADYRVVTNRQPGLIQREADTWPTIKSNTVDAVRVHFTAGYTAEIFPPGLRQATLIYVGYLFDNRGSQEPAKNVIGQLQSLLDNYRVGDDFWRYAS